MCTYTTEHLELQDSSGKVNGRWMPMTAASVYFDHPVHAPREHTVNIDFLNPERGASARVAVELSKESALALRAALDDVLAHAPELT